MPASPSPPPPRGNASQAVRLIGGRLKRSKLPVAQRPGLRPTPDRVRETLFNWLGQDLTGWRVLDAFAGTGALGLEAVSRGATEAVLLERDGTLATALHATCQRLVAPEARIVQADAVAWMRQATPQAFDLICLDPPFDAHLHEPALQAAVPLLTLEGLVYVEANRAYTAADVASLGLAPWRRGKAGTVHFHLFQRQAPAPEPAA